MKIKITRNTIANGRAAVSGEVLEVAESEARVLFGLGKAVPFSDPETIRNRDPEPASEPAATVESQDPKPTRRRKTSIP